MKRPLSDVRPLGPFARSDSGGLEIVVFTDVNVPQSAGDRIKQTAENEMGELMGEVKVIDENTGFVIDVGPEVLLEHEKFKTYEDMVSAVTDDLSDMLSKDVEVEEVTARCDSVSMEGKI